MKDQALRQIRESKISSLDTLVIFGEVFKGGYVNGLIQAAKSKGMTVIYSTVGRRTPEGSLRKLNTEEVNLQPKPFINVPLEAGFDQEVSKTGQSPVDMCRTVRLKDMENFSLNKDLLEDSREKAIRSFRKRTSQWLEELSNLLPEKGNLVIAHTMAGGVPRAKILLPLLNRVFKGTGSRFFSSQDFWSSDWGWFCQKNFSEVTAQTYRHLLELSSELRNQLLSQGRQIFYLGYSYHGTEVLMGNQYQWQSYSPYLQGFAKLELEQISRQFFHQKVNSCVFNVPEILTRSSAIFPGLEIPLYALFGALKKEGANKVLSEFTGIRDEDIQSVMGITQKYFESDIIQKQSLFKKWPQHNNPEHIQLMLNTSKTLSGVIDSSMNPLLSKVILNSCGRVILQELGYSQQPVMWLGHDIIAKESDTYFG